jgi:Zn-finger protein
MKREYECGCYFYPSYQHEGGQWQPPEVGYCDDHNIERQEEIKKLKGRIMEAGEMITVMKEEYMLTAGEEKNMDKIQTILEYMQSAYKWERIHV